MARRSAASAALGPVRPPAPRVGLAAAALIASLTAAAAAQPWVTFDAGLGTLPEAQCWTRQEQIDPPVPYASGIAAGALQLSTLGFAATGAFGGGVWWENTQSLINFDAPFALEARVRIVSSPDRSINTANGWPRPGYAIWIYDVTGRVFWIGLGSGEVFLSNSVFGQYGSANTVTTPFNTTDGYHDYRIERAAGGIGATLKIDGIQRLTLPSLGPIQVAGSSQVGFGDPTFWANSESLTSWVRYTGASNSGITAITGPDSVSACTNAATFAVAVAPTTGTYTYTWQIQTSAPPNENWQNLGSAPAPITCPGGGTGTAYASPANAPNVSIGVGGCAGAPGRVWPIRCIVTAPCGGLTSSTATLTITAARCNAADIAYDSGDALPPTGVCDPNLVNNGVTEGDYNLFFATFFDAGPACDIADDQSTPLPPFGTGGIAPAVNNGVTEGDYNLFFAIYFDGCAF